MSSKCILTRIGYVCISEINEEIISVKIGCRSRKKDSTNTLNKAFKQLQEYLDGKRRRFTLKCRPEGTDFQKDVWNALQKIPYGKTISYTELADMIGHPRSQRAVGNANKHNPIPLFIPCHRVIMANGNIGGYSSGVDIKEQLLKIEGSYDRCKK
ncbi:MAG: methylated-DNA--[protein]-cysteine S-methyltransferase [archaeon]|nr:methylated-DNA--[protein]-cysteine S-methyltransferase [archaeon]